MKLAPARVEWRDGKLFNVEYGDIYFSAAGAVGEAEHVFLHGNGLPSRWQGVERFAIGELGFGTGINFLVTLKNWLSSAPSNAVLHYVTVERTPLTLSCLCEVWSHFPALSELAAGLSRVYPEPVAGFHRRVMCAGRVSITFVWGDAQACGAQLDGPFDAWFLDGFMPRRNPELWQAALLKQVAQTCRLGATVATYSVASVVRDALRASGFDIEKRPGFGAKKEMLVGRYTAAVAGVDDKPWFARPLPRSRSERHAVIVGAGIAGVATAQALASRGWRVELLDRGDDLAAGASGNPAAVVMPLLSSDMNLSAQFSCAAFLYTAAWLSGLAQTQNLTAWHPTGVLHQQLPPQLCRLIKENIPDGLAQLVQTAPRSTVNYPRAGWVEGRALCAQLLQDSFNISVRCHTHISSIERQDNQWHVRDGDDLIAAAPVLVMATGARCDPIHGMPHFPLQNVRGQSTEIRARKLGLTMTQPICEDGYVVPVGSDRWWVGASFSPGNTNLAALAADTAKNCERLSQATGIAVADMQVINDFVSLRAATPDRFPLMGAVADPAWYQSHYADLRHGRTDVAYPSAQYLPDLYVTAGHGSRGYMTAPYMAQWLVDIIEHAPLPGPRRWLDKVHPERFFVRALKQGALTVATGGELTQVVK